MEGLIKILDIVLPVFLVVALGYGLGRRGLIDQAVGDRLSKLVFWVAAPALLFRSAARAELMEALDLRVVGVIALVSALVAGAMYVLAARSVPARRGVIAQGAYRSNLVFIGLPILINAFGEDALVLGKAAVVIGFTTPLYNLLAVVLLALPHSERSGRMLGKALKDIAINPLILSCVIGFGFSGFGIAIPGSLDVTLDLVGQTAMPLALLVVGATIDFGGLRDNLKSASAVSAARLIVYPALVYFALRALGVDDQSLKVAVLLICPPTAVISAIMAREMRGDHKLASDIIIVTTVYSLFTISFWVWLLV